MAVVAAPEADEPRLAYARFLRSDDLERSAFIESQVHRVRRQRAARDTDTEQMPLHERSMLEHDGEYWVREMRGYTARTVGSRPRVRFYRGFVEYIATDVATFVERGAELLRSAPIRHVDFAPMGRGDLDRLLNCPSLSGLDSVGFPGGGLDDDAVAAIAGCRYLSGCRYLDLTGNRLGLAAFAALAASDNCKSLLVVERGVQPDPDPASGWHPGERSAIGFLNSGSALFVEPMTAEGRLLEARHGFLPWLRWANRVSRFDARWYAERGLRPVPVALPEQVPHEVLTVFKERLREFARYSDLLPEVLEFGRAYEVEDPTDDRDFQDLRVRAEVDADGRIHLDYLWATEAYSRHGRIRPDGSSEALENYDGQFGRTVPADPRERERERAGINAHNQQVLEILQRKGLEDNAVSVPPVSPLPIRTNLGRCAGCRLPVLELTGQFTRLDSYLLPGDDSADGRPAAGTWHLTCLEAASGTYTGWRDLRVDNLRLRGYEKVAEVFTWTVLHRSVGSGSRTAERIAVAPSGFVLPMAFPSACRREINGGMAVATEEPELNLQLDRKWITSMQEALLATGRYPLQTVAAALGIRGRLHHPKVLRDASLCFGRDLVPLWTPHSVTARVFYHLFVPRPLVDHLVEPQVDDDL